MSFPRVWGARHAYDIADVTGRASGPHAFTQVTPRKVRRDEFSGAHICSPSSGPSCLRRLLTLAQLRESTEQTSASWGLQGCRGLSPESVRDDQPALPQVSLGARWLEIPWRKQRTEGSSSKALQTHLPVPSQFITALVLPPHTNRSFGCRQAEARSAVSG